MGTSRAPKPEVMHTEITRSFILESSVASPLMPFDAAQDRLRYAHETALLSTNGAFTNWEIVRSH